MFYSRALSASLQCLIVGVGIIGGGAAFSSNFQDGRSKESKIVEPGKFNLEIGVWGRGWWANSFFSLSGILRTFVYLLSIYLLLWKPSKND